MKWFKQFVEDARQEGEGLHGVLCKLAGLYGVWCLLRHCTLLYEGICGTVAVMMCFKPYAIQVGTLLIAGVPK